MNRRPAQAKVIYTPETENYLVDLAWILYEKQYFSYYHLAENYITLLIRDMETTFHLKQKCIVSKRFSKYGKNLYYVCYPKKQHTTWYFFFTYHPDNDTYFIRYITNNHVAGHLL
ncbi:MAG: hypothetical protein LUH10_02405 [Tannerellaceae bacterium]|nr:hypothetical protein [Tannerellaceae bacterium]